jgi:gliding motility-associated-like protein
MPLYTKLLRYLLSLISCTFLASSIYAQQPIAKINTTPAAISDTVRICSGNTLVFSSVSDSVIIGASLKSFLYYNNSVDTFIGAGPFNKLLSNTTNTGVLVLQVSNNNGTIVSYDSVKVITIQSPSSLISLTIPILPGYSTSTENGTTVFKRCNASDSSLFNLISSYDSSVLQNFIWGDLTSGNQNIMSGNKISHTYPLGQYTLTHQLQTANGCSASKQYIVFNGSAPFVTIAGAAQNTCVPFPYPIDLISNKVPIDYSVGFSDGSPNITFSTSSDTTIAHVFVKSSCGVDYEYAPGQPPIPNAFFGTVVAKNFCSVNNNPTVLTIGPINVSIKPTAIFNYTPLSPICKNETITFSNKTINGISINSSGCDSSYKFYWKINPSSHVNIVSGSTGNNNGYIGVDLNPDNWTNGSEILKLKIDSSGIYQMWLYAANSCGIDSFLRQLEVKEISDIIISTDSQQICSGDMTDVVTFTSTVPNYTIYWHVSDSSNVSLIPIKEGSGISPETIPQMVLYNYTNQKGFISISATVGCSIKPPTIHKINVDPESKILATPITQTICSDDIANIQLSSNIIGTSFMWTVSTSTSITGASNGSGMSIQQQLQNISNQNDTLKYHISATNTACPGPDTTVIVIVRPLLKTSNPPDVTICPWDTINTEPYTSNQPNTVYTWTNSNASIGIPNSGIGNLPQWIAPSNKTSTPIISTIITTAIANGCPPVFDTIKITINTEPIHSYTTLPTYGLNCITNTGTITIQTIPVNCILQWDGPFITSVTNANTIDINGPGIYHTIITNVSTGCSSIDSIKINPPTYINILNLVKEDVNCFNGNDGMIRVETDNKGLPLSFSWTPSVSSTELAINLIVGDYGVKVTNSSGCSDSSGTSITEPTPIIISLIDTNYSECGEANGSVIVDAIGGVGGYRFLWSNGIEGPEIKDIDSGIYQVTVYDRNNCMALANFPLICIDLIPPVAKQFISPNNDNSNDLWYVENIQLYPNNIVEIFNRWGNKVYSAEPYKNEWNGHYFKGDTDLGILPAGTYFYIIDTKKKSQKPFKGFIEVQP